jgi:hypothetical protein
MVLQFLAPILAALGKVGAVAAKGAAVAGKAGMAAGKTALSGANILGQGAIKGASMLGQGAKTIGNKMLSGSKILGSSSAGGGSGNPSSMKEKIMSLIKKFIGGSLGTSQEETTEQQPGAVEFKQNPYTPIQFSGFANQQKTIGQLISEMLKGRG